MSENPQPPRRMSDREFLLGTPPPVESTAGVGFQGGTAGGPNPKSRVSAPGIALAVIGGLAVATSLINTAQSIVNYLDPAAFAAQMEDLKQQLGEDFPYPEMFDQIVAVSGSPLTLVVNGLSILTALLALVGGLQMLKLQRYGLAFAGAIAAMIPLGSCCCVGLPVGLWAIVILLNPEVREAFKANSL